MATFTTRAQPSGLPCPHSSASFWHTEPSPFLLAHRTTDHLPSEVDIVIIGTGITGASIAHYLTAQSTDLSIVLLDAREVCSGATGRNGGHCQPLLFDRTPDVAAFEVRNVEAVKSYIGTNNVECEWRTVTGCRSFWDNGLFEACQADIAKLRDVDPVLGKRVTVIPGSDENSLREHGVSVNAVGVTLTEGAGQLWPYKLVTFMIEKMVREGKVNLQTNTPVLKIGDKDPSSSRRKLRTPRGIISARYTILATNGYTSHLLPDTFTDLIVPVRHEMSALHPPQGTSRLPHSYGMVGYAAGNPDHDDYLIQRPFTHGPDGTLHGGQLMFGGGRGKATYGSLGTSNDDIIDPGSAHYLCTELPNMLNLSNNPHTPSQPLIASHIWTGITGYSKDNAPWVGRVPADPVGTTWHTDLWLCGGYTGHGMPNATLCGKALATMISAEIAGENHEDVSSRLVRAGDLPRQYLITAQRLSDASRLPSVAAQEAESERMHREKRRLKAFPSVENGMPLQNQQQQDRSRCEVM